MVSNFPDEKVWKWVYDNMDAYTTTSLQNANYLDSDVWIFSPAIKREIVLTVTRFCVI